MSKADKFFFCMSQLPMCCGALEAGEFVIGEKANYFHDTPAELDDTLVKVLQRERPVFLNFVQVHDFGADRFEDDYECQQVLDILLADKSGLVVDLGTWINPNSDNRIHGLMIKGKAHE